MGEKPKLTVPPFASNRNGTDGWSGIPTTYCTLSVAKPYALPEVKRWLEWGSGPRASQYLLLGAKARALLHGRFHATTDDIAAIAKPVLRHRMVLNFAAESEGLTTDTIVDRVLEALRPRK